MKNIILQKNSEFEAFSVRRYFAIFNIVFCLIYFYFIYKLYSSKKKCEEGGYESDVTTDLTTRENLDLDDTEKNAESINLQQFVPPSKDSQN